MSNKTWDTSEISNLSGKTAVVTGANTGLGFEVASVLARKGARVFMASRSTEKGHLAADALRQSDPAVTVKSLALDLADLDSVLAFASDFKNESEQLDILVNNAGVMALPYGKTKDGFEMQLGTNHLGHFALTGLLLDRLIATPRSRVVTVSSNAHKPAKMRFDDLQWENGYKRWKAYGMSKLANLLFCYEFARKIRARNLNILSLAAHPGLAATNLFISPRMQNSKLVSFLCKTANDYLAQDVKMGALPILYAATVDTVKNGDYFGPADLREWRGYPVKVSSSRRSRNTKDAVRLWRVSEELTAVHWNI
jgi:NAD(P)-dependent dehydrogenase (short-subunit alcohol dehydrogenase family)